MYINLKQYKSLELSTIKVKGGGNTLFIWDLVSNYKDNNEQ